MDVPPKPLPWLAAKITRREFFLKGGGAFFWTAMTAFSYSFLRLFFPRVLFEPFLAFKAGFPDEYAEGAVSERWKKAQGVWIIRNSDRIYALSTRCTHLGCTPNWLDQEKKFKCPCHGSGFYPDGVNFEGPAPRPLERFRIALAEDGQLLIDKSRVFRAEKGEWDDPDSFVVV